nr:DUF2088 domain-containing protein [Candidatus Bathyarchaeota archaeon]
MGESEMKLPYGGLTVKIRIPYPMFEVSVNPVEGVRDPEVVIRDCLRQPLGLDELSGLVKKGSKVTICFEGVHVPGGYRRHVLRILLQELQRAGVRKEDVTLVAATGVYRKPSFKELSRMIGADVAGRHTLIIHDCENQKTMVRIGETPFGDPLEVNKWVVESDLTIILAKVIPWSFWGGYNSGSRVLSLDLTSIRTAEQYYDFDVVSNAACNGDPYRNPLQRACWKTVNIVEDEKGSPLFFVEIVSSIKGALLAAKAGRQSEVEKTCWREADRQYLARVRERGGLLVLGVPEVTFLGETGRDPIALLHALTYAFRNYRNKPSILRDGIVLTAAECSEPVGRGGAAEAFKMLLKVESIEELRKHHELQRKPALIKAYREGEASHPLYQFFTLYPASFILDYVDDILIFGCKSHRAAKAIRGTPIQKESEAFKIIEEQLGPDPLTIASPDYFVKGPAIQAT